MWDSIIIFEQPMNELVRTCLRLEQLFKTAVHHIDKDSAWDSRATLGAIIQIANVLDRSDLRSKLGKEIRRQIEILTRHQDTPSIDLEALQQLLAKLEKIYENLQTTEGRLGQTIRENEFLNIVRQHLFNPGGACSFDAPLYHHWLQRSIEHRQYDLNQWLHAFDSIRATITVLLQIVRESATPRLKTAHEGFYQEPLDPRAAWQLIRVIIPRDAEVFPEISAGKHRISVRFYLPCIEGRPTQTQANIDFKLTYCIV